LILVVLTLVGGFSALGTLLAVGIMMLPAAAARFWANDLDGMIVAATLTAIISSVIGLIVSYHSGLPTGPVIILSTGGIYALSLLFGPRGGLVTRLVPRLHLEA
jgi:zinc/manganese transport system permease protein